MKYLANKFNKSVEHTPKIRNIIKRGEKNLKTSMFNDEKTLYCENSVNGENSIKYIRRSGFVK